MAAGNFHMSETKQVSIFPFEQLCPVAANPEKAQLSSQENGSKIGAVYWQYFHELIARPLTLIGPGIVIMLLYLLVHCYYC